MPGLVSTLLNQAYSTPGRLVQTFLQVTEQVWQPMHLSRFSTMPICARTFMFDSFAGSTASMAGADGTGRLVEPVDLVHLAHHHELVAVRAYGSVVVEAVAQLRVAADHVRGFEHDARDRVVDAAARAGDL